MATFGGTRRTGIADVVQSTLPTPGTMSSTALCSTSRHCDKHTDTLSRSISLSRPEAYLRKRLEISVWYGRPSVGWWPSPEDPLGRC